MDNLNIKNLYGQQTEKIGIKDNAVIYHTKYHNGDGTIELYELFNGIHLYLMDLYVENIDYSQSELKVSDNIFTIYHCQQGRFEGEFNNGEYVYLSEGDVALNMPKKAIKRNCFPLGRFKGMMIIIELDKAMNAIEELNPILTHIKEKLLVHHQIVVYRNIKNINHIISSMYQNTEINKDFYLKLKVLELLYDLSIEDIQPTQSVYYFKKNQIQTVKNIKTFLVKHPEKRYTIKQLSEQFNISQTSLKKCFKTIYGVPINTYMKEYRMNIASQLLLETNLSIAEIAEKVGYSNPSKFSEAFKKQLHYKPIEYRNKMD